MNNPVAPKEGPLYLLFAEYENTTNIRKWSKEPFDDAVEYVRKSDYADLIAACDEALDWADANARAFPIETAPKKGGFLAWGSIEKEWISMGSWTEFVEFGDDSYTLWTPLPPPPSNPPLPEPLERLGGVLRKVKGVG